MLPHGWQILLLLRYNVTLRVRHTVLFGASCDGARGGCAGGRPGAHLTVIVDWERVGSFMVYACACGRPFGNALSGSQGGLAATPFDRAQLLPPGVHPAACQSQWW